LALNDRGDDATGGIRMIPSRSFLADETPEQLAAAMVKHGMAKLAGREYFPASRDSEMAAVSAGAFIIVHCRPDGWRGGEESFDVSTSGKALEMRRDHGKRDWELVSMSSGDWEIAFLLT
jgi:hypothetical protein